MHIFFAQLQTTIHTYIEGFAGLLGSNRRSLKYCSEKYQPTAGHSALLRFRWKYRGFDTSIYNTFQVNVDADRDFQHKAKPFRINWHTKVLQNLLRLSTLKAMSKHILIYKKEEIKSNLFSFYQKALATWPVPYEEFMVATHYGDTHVIASGAKTGSSSRVKLTTTS